MRNKLPDRTKLRDPAKWRRLAADETVNEGDVIEYENTRYPLEWAAGMIGAAAGLSNWYRPVDSYGWVNVSDRLPTEADGVTVPGYPSPLVLGRTSNHVGPYYWNKLSGVIQWCRIPPLLEPPIVIGEHVVEFKESGVQVGCTFVPSETVKAVAARLK